MEKLQPLEILTYPAAPLLARAAEVLSFDEGLRLLVRRMHLTMKAANGIGLAANQVGVLSRVIVLCIPTGQGHAERLGGDRAGVGVDWDGAGEDPTLAGRPLTLVNPTIVEPRGKISCREGCLSFPGLFEFIVRSAQVQVKYQDEWGKEQLLTAAGLAAVCIQHEIDHLNGIVFTGRMSRLKKSLWEKKLRGMKEADAI